MTHPLPQNWQKGNLGDFCNFSQGVQVDLELQSKRESPDLFPFLRIENYTQNSKDFRYIEANSKIQKKMVHKNDIVVVRYGASAGFIGKGFKGVLANNLFKVSATSVVSTEYLYLVLKRPETYQFFQSEMVGGAMPALSFKIVEKLNINLPPLPEQRRIVAVLETWDKAIEKLEQKIEVKKNVKKGLMQKLLTGKVRLPGFTKDWEEKMIEEIAKVNPKSNGIPDHFVYIDLESVNKGILTSEKRITAFDAPSRAQRLLKKNDILFQLVRPYQRNNYLFSKEGDYVASTGYAQLRASESTEFLYHYLHFDQFVEKVLAQCTGSSYPAINSNDLEKIKINIPKPKEQEVIAKILTSSDSEIELFQSKLLKLKAQKAYLLNHLITGRIRTPEDMYMNDT